ncbi:putative hydrolase of the HAD superfamily [Pedobacter sp. AK013]|uniref:HAD family hydrolase n=1 Tax=Pedobacter sp. AK013 TaxID=2723071 RepID=UPI00161C98CC|nr:HAD hydrolase-like protein [Pedobacter sp. AK013]MBB6237070.1 putative hydrolase of the HAD superfamily [Pedobacter sp. AK013]
MKHIFFIDLDNTIYFAKANEEQLMGELYRFLEKLDLGISKEDFQLAKQEMLRTPFLKMAKKYGFKQEVMPEIISYLENREVTKPLKPSNDYHHIKSLTGRKFIVTAGFRKQQISKIKMLGITDDFEEVHVVDVSITNKKKIFEMLIDRHHFNKEDILIIGDDAESEIKFGLELGISTFLLDPENLHPNAETTFRGNDLSNLHTAAGQ